MVEKSGERLMDMEIIDLMIERSGLTSEIIDKGAPDPRFSKILSGMTHIHKGKEVLYGSYLETHGDDPELFALMEHFADLKRKYIRAEHFMKKRMEGQDIELEELFDTYSDMAVYAAMGIDLIYYIMEQKCAETQDRVS